MQDTESNKKERRLILSNLQDWNIGITPYGKLATEPCFVHNAVPNIVYELNPKAESTFICTKSEWTTNLLVSNTSNPCDTASVKSLSICSSIFHPEPKLNIRVFHLVNHNVKAHIEVDNIARLTKEFMDELSKAEEHWPHSPQKSWDRMCLIWNKYGFLWPRQVKIGYKSHSKIEAINNTNIQSVKSHLEKMPQDTLHNQSSYSVIWRIGLKPMHDFFPAQYTKTRDFINNVILKFSNLLFNDSLFTLKNLKSGDYLSRQRSSQLDLSKVTTVSVSSRKAVNNSNIFWKFNTFSNETSPYIVAGDDQLLCSGQFDITEPTYLSRSKQKYSIDRKSVQFCAADINLIQYRQPRNQSTASYDMDVCLKWEVHILDTASKSQQLESSVFDLDGSIEKFRCLMHGNNITLNQQSFYLRSSQATYSTSICKTDSINSTSPTVINVQRDSLSSPSSGLSFDNQYNFSSCEQSESMSTQPTSRSNSINDAGLLPNSKNRNYEINQNSNPLPHGRLAFIERLSQEQEQETSKEFIWKVEMISKTIVNEENEDMTKSIENLSLKSSSDANKPKLYSPGLDFSVMFSPFTFNDNEPNDQSTIIPNNRIISSFIPCQSSEETTKKVLDQQQRYLKPQKSKWLDVNPKLYNLQSESSGNDTIYSRYETPLESVRSIPSPADEFKPKMSEKRLGKQPAHATKTQVYHASDETDSWSSSQSPSPIDKNTDIFMSKTLSPDITEAESFKRGYQESHMEGNAHKLIFQNILLGSPMSSTSHVRYYDDNDDVYTSSQVRSYTMTPHSRYSQQMTPSSSANLTPEEYMKRKMSRENSFMLLIDRETKQQFWLRAIKQSSLSQCIQFISSIKKKLSIIYHKEARKSNSQANSNDLLISFHTSNNPKVIQKKKGFYHKKNRKHNGIII